MLKRLSISNFRGVKSGVIEDLRPLSIFVGRNGQGKSTILEAAFIFSTAPRVDTLVYVITRRGWRGPAMWQFLTPASTPERPQPLAFTFTFSGIVLRDKTNQVELKVDCSLSRNYDGTILAQARQENIAPDIQITVGLSGDRAGITAAIVGIDGKLSTPMRIQPFTSTAIDGASFLDADSFRQPQAVTAALSNATVGGWLESALSFARRVVPGLSDIRIVEINNDSVTMLYYGGGKSSIPFHVAGDGVRRIIELSLGVLGGPPGIIAIEEPENFLHPGSRRVCAELIWAAIDRGEQVMVSTHNLDLLDDLLGMNGEKPRESDKVAIYRTSLKDGNLETIRIAGKDAKDSREILGQDLLI